MMMPSKTYVLSFSVVYPKAPIPIRKAVVTTMESAKKSVKVGSGNVYDAENIYAHLASAYYSSENRY